MGVDIDKVEELKKAVVDLGEDTQKKITILQHYIKQAKEKEASIALKIKELKALKIEVETKEKGLRYTQLRLLKMINDKKLDNELRETLKIEIESKL